MPLTSPKENGWDWPWTSQGASTMAQLLGGKDAQIHTDSQKIGPNSINQRIHGSPTGYCSTRAALLHIATLVGGLFAPPVSLKDTVLILIFGSCRFLRGEWETVLRLSSSTWLVHASQGLDKQHSMQMHQIVSTYHVVPIPSSDCQNRFCCRKMSSRSRRNLRSNVATIHP